jgi:hypothetical protein
VSLPISALEIKNDPISSLQTLALARYCNYLETSQNTLDDYVPLELVGTAFRRVLSRLTNQDVLFTLRRAESNLEPHKHTPLPCIYEYCIPDEADRKAFSSLIQQLTARPSSEEAQVPSVHLPPNVPLPLSEANKTLGPRKRLREEALPLPRKRPRDECLTQPLYQQILYACRIHDEICLSPSDARMVALTAFRYLRAVEAAYCTGSSVPKGNLFCSTHWERTIQRHARAMAQAIMFDNMPSFPYGDD